MTIHPTLHEAEAPRIVPIGSRVGSEHPLGRGRACSTPKNSITEAAVSWFAIQVLSNREQKVREDLERRQIENYLPSYQEKRRWADRDKILDIPLFRGYVFARIENVPEWRMEVLKVSGTSRIVGAVSQQEIASVKAMLEVGARPFAGSNPLLKTGCRVRVKHGALLGVEGIFVRHKNQDRLVLSIDLLGQAVSTEIDVGDVEVLQK